MINERKSSGCFAYSWSNLLTPRQFVIQFKVSATRNSCPTEFWCVTQIALMWIIRRSVRSSGIFHRFFAFYLQVIVNPCSMYTFHDDWPQDMSDMGCRHWSVRNGQTERFLRLLSRKSRHV